MLQPVGIGTRFHDSPGWVGMSDFSFIPLGVGDAFSALYYSSCLLLEAEGQRLLIDCPHPIRKILREAGQRTGCFVDIPDISGIALTHLHSDHCSGIEGYAFYQYYVAQPGTKTKLLAHPDICAHLWKHHLAGGMAHVQDDGTMERTFEEFFDWTPLSTEYSVSWGPFSIECHKTVHSIPTTAFRIRAAGRCLGYSADTAFVPELIEWLSEADLIIHETNTGPHTPYESLASLPADIRQKMRLIHYPDNFSTTESTIEPLTQGQVYHI